MMGGFLIKPDPRHDLYMVWSSVEDGPLWAGSAAAWQNYGQQLQGGFSTEERQRRADECGTSEIDGEYGLGRP